MEGAESLPELLRGMDPRPRLVVGRREDVDQVPQLPQSFGEPDHRRPGAEARVERAIGDSQDVHRGADLDVEAVTNYAVKFRRVSAGEDRS